MRFERIRYLEWAKRRFDEQPPAYNLAASGMQLASAADLGLGAEPLPISGNNTFGHPVLRARLAEQYGVTPAHVLMATGTSLANFLVTAAILRDGDRALCEWPVYEPLWRVLDAGGEGRVREARPGSCVSA